MNILDDETSLRELISEANDLQRHLGMTHALPFDIRPPRRLVEGKAGRWVIHQPRAWPTRAWTVDEFIEHLDELKCFAQRHADQLARSRRMADLNARVRALLGDTDFEFYTSTLIGYGSPRG